MQPRTRRRTLAVTAFSLLLACVGDTVRAQSWLGDASVGVQVRGAGGALTGARVEVLYRGPGGESGGPAPRATNEQGQASFTGLAEGVWSLEVSHPDHLSFIATLSLRSARKTEVVSSFLEASGAGRNPLRVRLFQPGTRLLGTPLTVSKAPPTAPAEAPEPVQAPAAPTAEEAPAEVDTEPPGAVEMDSPADDTPSTPSPAAEPAAPAAPPIAEPAVVEPPIEQAPAVEPTAPAEAPADEPPAETAATAPTVQAPSDPANAVEPAPEEPAPAPSMAEPTAAEPPAPMEPPPAVERSAAPAPPAMPAPTTPVPGETPPADEPPARSAPTPPVEEAAPKPPPVEPDVTEPDEPPAPTEAPANEPPDLPAPADTPAPTVPAPTAPRPVVEPPAAEPTPPPPAASALAEPPDTPPPAAASPEPLRGADASARSFRDRTCFECKPGEWAVGASSEVPAGNGCPAGALDRAAAGIELLAARVAPALAGYGGNALSPEALGRLDGAGRTEVGEQIDSLLDPRSPCRLVALALPAGARMSGFRFEAFEDGDGGDCVGDQPCPVGDSRWLASPGIERGDGATVLWAVFENRSDSRARLARFIGYFTPPSGWRP